MEGRLQKRSRGTIVHRDDDDDDDGEAGPLSRNLPVTTTFPELLRDERPTVVVNDSERNTGASTSTP